MDDNPESSSGEFERQTESSQPSVVREMFDQLRHNRKWWLTPIIIGLLLAGVIVMLGGTAVAPFIYTLF